MVKSFFSCFLLLIISISFGVALEKYKVIIFGDSLSDAGYANNLYRFDTGWPKISSTPVIFKQATYSSPLKNQTVWPQFLSLGFANEYAGISNNMKTPIQNIDKSVTPNLKGNDYAAGGATTICQGIGKDNDYTPPPIGPLKPGEICPSESKNIQHYNQIDSYLRQHHNKADQDTIYIIWGGANNAFLLLKNLEIVKP